MSELIDAICNNFDVFTKNGIYYEEELFTKFEDAIIKAYEDASFMALKSEKDDMAEHLKNGINIIHGARSQVCFVDPDSSNEYKCEMGDIQLVFEDPEKIEVRRVFLQFKVKDSQITSDEVITIPDRQAILYLKNCPVTWIGTNRIDPPVAGSCEPNTMVAIIWDQKHLCFANLKKLTGIGCKKSDHKRFEIIRAPGYTDPVEIINQSPGSEYEYDYCVYAETLNDFLECAANMQVGEVIPDSGINGLCLGINPDPNDGPGNEPAPGPLPAPEVNADANTVPGAASDKKIKRKNENQRDYTDVDEVARQGIRSTVYIDVSILRNYKSDNKAQISKSIADKKEKRTR